MPLSVEALLAVATEPNVAPAPEALLHKWPCGMSFAFWMAPDVEELEVEREALVLAAAAAAATAAASAAGGGE